MLFQTFISNNATVNIYVYIFEHMYDYVFWLDS